MAADAIKTIELTKSYRSPMGKLLPPALNGLCLTVKEGEIFGFLGQNGAGKTTTIKLLCSLLRPTSGYAYVFGDDAYKRAARRHIGYLPENPYFYEYLTPRETLDFYGKLHGLNANQRAQEWKRLADLLDLARLEQRRVREFSKGMRQRLAFAAALVGDPPLLILDEPMSGLDPIGRRQTRELILQLRDVGKTIFFSSHVLSDVEQICDRVGILVKGKLVSEGRIDQLVQQKIQLVEVVADNLESSVADFLGKKALRTRVSEAGYHFFMPDLESANELVREIQNYQGKLVEFSPVRESLEDYFMRQQIVS